MSGYTRLHFAVFFPVTSGLAQAAGYTDTLNPGGRQNVSSLVVKSQKWLLLVCCDVCILTCSRLNLPSLQRNRSVQPLNTVSTPKQCRLLTGLWSVKQYKNSRCLHAPQSAFEIQCFWQEKKTSTTYLAGLCCCLLHINAIQGKMLTMSYKSQQSFFPAELCWALGNKGKTR